MLFFFNQWTFHPNASRQKVVQTYEINLAHNSLKPSASWLKHQRKTTVNSCKFIQYKNQALRCCKTILHKKYVIVVQSAANECLKRDVLPPLPIQNKAEIQENIGIVNRAQHTSHLLPQLLSTKNIQKQAASFANTFLCSYEISGVLLYCTSYKNVTVHKKSLRCKLKTFGIKRIKGIIKTEILYKSLGI